MARAFAMRCHVLSERESAAPLATAAIFDLGVFLCVLGAVLLALASLARLALKTGETPNTGAYDLEEPN